MWKRTYYGTCARGGICGRRGEQNQRLAAFNRASVWTLQGQFFLEFGFRLDAWMEMQESLLRHVKENGVVDREVTEFGTKYVVEGPLVSPDGRNPGVRTVWVIDPGEQRPRFVTAYPI